MVPVTDLPRSELVPALPRPESPAELEQAIAAVQQQLSTMMFKARQSIRERAACIHPELQPMGFKVLTILAGSGPLQQVALVQEVCTDKAVMSRTIKMLESLELVTRTADPADGRAVLVAITPDARTRLADNSTRTQQRLVDRLSAWELAEVRQLAASLERLVESAL